MLPVHPHRSRLRASAALVAGLLAVAGCDQSHGLALAPAGADTPARVVPANAAAHDATTDPTSVGVSLADPIGDTLGFEGVQLDLTAFTVTRDTGGLVVRLDFAQDLPKPVVGPSPSITGLVELDLDQNRATGHGASLDILHRFLADGGSTAMGVDASIGLAPLAPDSTAPVYDATNHVIGRVRPVFAGRTVTIRVPWALLRNDDGNLDATVLVGNGLDATDFAPRNGHVSLANDVAPVWP